MNLEIMKILDSMGMRGTFYVDSGNPRWTNNGLADSDLRTIAMRHEVGSHTWSHVDCRKCDARTLRDELTRSKEYIEGVLREPVHGFAYPYGEYSSVSENVARESGYLFARTTVQGNVEFPPANPFLWGISVWALDLSPYFLKEIVSRTVLNSMGRLYVRNFAWDWRRLTLRLLEKARVANGVLHIFGHALEVLRPKLKSQFLEVCSKLAFRKDVWYATNGMLFLNERIRESVRITPHHDSENQFLFSVDAEPPFDISPEMIPMPLRLTIPEGWRDFQVQVSAASSGRVETGRVGRQEWIDIFDRSAKITVSRH